MSPVVVERGGCVVEYVQFAGAMILFVGRSKGIAGLGEGRLPLRAAAELARAADE